MIIYELNHYFEYLNSEIVLSAKHLGYFVSYEEVENAIQFYRKSPGFCDNPNSFIIRRRYIQGDFKDNIIYEAIVYIHSEDYEIETEVELGLFGDFEAANDSLNNFRNDNNISLFVEGLSVEEISNKCILGKYEWQEGFMIDKNN